MICGVVVTSSEKTVALGCIENPEVKPDGTIEMPEEFKKKTIVYPHNNLNQDGLKTLCAIGELLEFLILDGKIVGVL